MTDSLLKIIFIGDIIGSPGRRAVRELLPGLKQKYNPDIVIANGENSAGGFGITPEIFSELKDLKINVVTTGNHVWDKKEIIPFLKDSGPKESQTSLIRPANYPEGAPGSGFTIFTTASGAKIGVANLSGRIFMDSLECPFRTGLPIIEKIRQTTPVIIIDMHAEATSEKAATGWFFDGKVSAVIGTHTHVQTSDEKILPAGTAFITDAGMTGPTDSVIGMKKDIVLETFLTKMPSRFDVATDAIELQGVFVAVNASSGKAVKIERVKERLR